MKQEIEKKRCEPAEFLIRKGTRTKTGNKTDYASRQYLGSVGKIEHGIVSVNAYGIYQNISFPLITKIFKPKRTLKDDDIFKTKIELAIEIINYLVSFGFNIHLVLADSFYGEIQKIIMKKKKKRQR